MGKRRPKVAGMRYVIFTTKHHDGFSMFDSKYTDYKVIDTECPFSSNKKANITKEIFDAFRKEGMWVGAYFSKPDWNHKNYWDPNFPPKDRNVNYFLVCISKKMEKTCRLYPQPDFRTINRLWEG